MKDAHTKKSRGFGFIVFTNKHSVDEAKNNANHDKILQNHIRVAVKRNPKEFD